MTNQPGGAGQAEAAGRDVDVVLGEQAAAVNPPDSGVRVSPELTPLPPTDSNVDYVALPIGYRLAEYTIESVLGSGGFGLTYLARDNHLECEVAIKEYLPHDMAIRVEGQTVCPRSKEWAPDYQVGLKRFLAEARTLASFRHPNIVRITRFFEANGTAYMVMDYERGEPLKEWRRNRPRVTEDELLSMFLPLLEGLEVVHQGKVTHRDIKPANIYVREADGSLVLLDFGSARYTASATHGLTTIVTPGYAPFEQYHTHGVQGPWSDIYAMGGVMYWMITGEKPMEAPARLKEDTMVPAREMARERFNSTLLAAIDWALQTDEEKRPRSVAEFRAALTGQMEVPKAAPASAAHSESTPALPSAVEEKPEVPKKSSKVLWIGLAVAGLAAGGFAVKHFMSAPATNPQPAPAPVVAAASATLQQTPPASIAPVPVQESPAPAPETTNKPIEKPAEPKHAATKPTIQTNTATTQEAKREPVKEQVRAGQGAKLTFKVVPYGDVYLDGKKIGRTPPLSELPLSAGKHKLEIHGDAMPFVATYFLDLKAGETKPIWTKFGSD